MNAIHKVLLDTSKEINVFKSLWEPRVTNADLNGHSDGIVPIDRYSKVCLTLFRFSWNPDALSLHALATVKCECAPCRVCGPVHGSPQHVPYESDIFTSVRLSELEHLPNYDTMPKEIAECAKERLISAEEINLLLADVLSQPFDPTNEDTPFTDSLWIVGLLTVMQRLLAAAFDILALNTLSLNQTLKLNSKVADWIN